MWTLKIQAFGKVREIMADGKTCYVMMHCLRQSRHVHWMEMHSADGSWRCTYGTPVSEGSAA